MVRAVRHTHSLALWLASIVCVVVLRVFAPAAPLPPAVTDAPPPPMQDTLSVADDGSDDGAGAPSDDADGDDDPDDAVLPATIDTHVPRPAASRPSWRLVALFDKHAGDPLFHPPRAA